MDYKEMWEELKQNITKDIENLQHLSENVYRNSDERIKGKLEGVKLAQDRILVLETVYKDELPPEEGIEVYLIGTPNGYVESVNTTKIIKLPYAKRLEHRLGVDVFLNEKDATKKYNEMFGIEGE